MAQKPSIPKGTRDFSPAEMMRRNYIFDTIRSVFRTYGFAPLETPAMENLSTLLGKYGDEGDKLLFRVLNSGDYAAGLSDEEVRQASRISEKGLRYDLTVPFARYVVQHQGELTFPFKRYQMQPVWRADPAAEGALPRVLPVRRRCHRHPLAAVRSGARGDRRAGVPRAGHPCGAEDEQPQDSLRHCRGDRPCRPR